MPRPILAYINQAALAHNLSITRRYAPHARITAVIKANAYGHGLMQTADALKSTDGFALLELEAAINLRDAGYNNLPILLLEGFFQRMNWLYSKNTGSVRLFITKNKLKCSPIANNEV